MDNGQKQWEKLINMPQEYEGTSIADKVIAEHTSQTVQLPKPSFWKRHLKLLVASACIVGVLVGVCVGIPLYHKLSTPPILYYAENDVVYEEVANPTAFVEENNLDILYFHSAAMVTTKVASIEKTGEFGFIEQKTLHIVDENFFDKVNFWGVGKQNVEFNFYGGYENLDKVHTMNDISIAYRLHEMSNTQERRILARFTYEKGEYFLDIVTEQDGLQQLEVYVNMLLAQKTA